MHHDHFNTEIVNRTTVLPDPDLPVVRIARVFDAPPEVVLRAHTDASLVEKWGGPNADEFVLNRWDARTGGAWRIIDRGKARFGSFHEVSIDRIVRTLAWEERPDDVTLEIITLIDLKDGRTRMVTKSISATMELRDGWLDSGHGERMTAQHERLTALLSELPTTV